MKIKLNILENGKKMQVKNNSGKDSFYRFTFISPEEILFVPIS